MGYPRIMIIGADNTSDRFGAALAEKLAEKCPNVSIFGVGGPLMSDAGVRLLYDISEMVSLGVFDSLKGAHVVKRLIHRVSETMDEERPNVVIQVGLPAFSFRLLEIAHCKSLKTMYYYTPISRGLTNVKLEQFAKVVDKVAGISRFEAETCKNAGIDVEFVGHPLLDLVPSAIPKEEARKALGISSTAPVISILPGAREVEVRNVLPTVLKSLCQVKRQGAELEIVVSVASTIRQSFMDRLISKCREGDVKLRNDTYTVLQAADLAITSIGTASLEAALTGIPSLAVYKVPATTYLFDKMFARKPHMTVTNNVLQEAVIPEFIQSDFGQNRIADEILNLLKDEDKRQSMVSEFRRLHEQLGEKGALDRAVDLILREAIGPRKTGTCGG